MNNILDFLSIFLYNYIVLKIEKNKNIKAYTTLQLSARVEFFAVMKSKENLQEAIIWSKKNKKPLFILGGGSNVLISRTVKGLTLKNEIKGIKVVEKNRDYVLVEAKSGELWSDFVDWSVRHNWHGLENLSLIYGTVGAAPMQNIGAYGVEIKDSFYHLHAIDLKSGQERIFSGPDCHFAYRESIFKNKLKGKYFIYAVTFKLQKMATLQLDYGAIRAHLLERGIKKPSLKNVSATIKIIRTEKLPNPVKMPNAGSFFKNLEISTIKFKALQKKYPDMPSWPISKTKVKIPAAWLIETAGFKGKKFGAVGMHKNQALVLINYRRASARQVLNLVKKIKQTVKKSFGLDLHEEVNII
ncbi:UDP-N-acetylenolpyruvoylglucosamine reductase [Candidatus Falkowbacteria bacterium CG10_big_fil_rev_8_21_14_0_10_37_18]|uniref:UDP-N-acetylenolpyruvoylglucosamine reductase n=1 Tax=Candidatus Falkowbacteria bacterium CG10_big_fil_rev_8_21_14_0_10_37_18 TaxID=1974562 RepID=A0A2H0V8Y2_9BACT|nr:MAG: UDP-N-acetylenolpyruvoylglucosamine reductase [Candidatus Falkowbacteria bacterium CG10_big_fil_rev_8_21_14_0_10_37_18]